MPATCPRDILARLVAFPTVSDRPNRALVDFAADHLARCGARLLRVPDAADPGKASLVAAIGPDVAGGVVLSGHTDVVPVAAADWASDPFRLDERHGRLHGRGTADMKGFVALALALAPEMAAARLGRPIVIALSHDEEIGCLGAPPMIDAMLEGLPPPSAVIVGEPSMMQVVSGHKAGLRLDIAVRGHEVHSSVMHRGVSAVMEAGRLIGWLAEQTEANAAAAAAGEGGDPAFDPAWTTLHVGKIAGGTANNITAADCRFVVDVRVLPSEDPEDWERRVAAEAARLTARMRRVHEAAGIAVARANFVPACAEEPGGAAETLARALTGDAARRVVAFATEAGQFQERGLSAVICGPGSIEQAHKPDEYISAEQFAAGERFLRRLIDRLAA